MKLTKDELEFFFIWRGLSQDEQWQIEGMIELLLEQRAERELARKNPKLKPIPPNLKEKNNVIRLASEGARRGQKIIPSK